MRSYHPRGSRRKLCQKFLASGPWDKGIDLELSGAAGLMGFSPFWDLRENTVPRKVLKQKEVGGKGAAEMETPFRRQMPSSRRG